MRLTPLVMSPRDYEDWLVSVYVGQGMSLSRATRRARGDVAATLRKQGDQPEACMASASEILARLSADSPLLCFSRKASSEPGTNR